MIVTSILITAPCQKDLMFNANMTKVLRVWKLWPVDGTEHRGSPKADITAVWLIIPDNGGMLSSPGMKGVV